MNLLIAYILGILSAIVKKSPSQSLRDTPNAQEKGGRENDNISEIRFNHVLTKYDESQQDHGRRDDRQYSTQNSIRRAAWLAAIAATVYGGINYRQWSDSHDNFITSQRAWVGVTTAPIMGITYVSGSIGVHAVLNLKNFGLSPAFKVVPQIALTTTDSQVQIMSGCMSKKEWDALQNDVTPKDVEHRYQGNAVFPNEEIPWEFTAGGGNGRGVPVKPGDAMFIVGCLTYFDEFRATRHTKFCLFSGTPAPPVNAPTDGSYFPVSNMAFRHCAMIEDAD